MEWLEAWANKKKTNLLDFAITLLVYAIYTHSTGGDG
jgi:hypothetical protein